MDPALMSTLSGPEEMAQASQAPGLPEGTAELIRFKAALNTIAKNASYSTYKQFKERYKEVEELYRRGEVEKAKEKARQAAEEMEALIKALDKARVQDPSTAYLNAYLKNYGLPPVKGREITVDQGLDEDLKKERERLLKKLMETRKSLEERKKRRREPWETMDLAGASPITSTIVVKSPKDKSLDRWKAIEEKLKKDRDGKKRAKAEHQALLETGPPAGTKARQALERGAGLILLEPIAEKGAAGTLAAGAGTGVAAATIPFYDLAALAAAGVKGLSTVTNPIDRALLSKASFKNMATDTGLYTAGALAGLALGRGTGLGTLTGRALENALKNAKLPPSVRSTLSKEALKLQGRLGKGVEYVELPEETSVKTRAKDGRVEILVAEKGTVIEGPRSTWRETPGPKLEKVKFKLVDKGLELRGEKTTSTAKPDYLLMGKAREKWSTRGEKLAKDAGKVIEEVEPELAKSLSKPKYLHVEKTSATATPPARTWRIKPLEAVMEVRKGGEKAKIRAEGKPGAQANIYVEEGRLGWKIKEEGQAHEAITGAIEEAQSMLGASGAPTRAGEAPTIKPNTLTTRRRWTATTRKGVVMVERTWADRPGVTVVGVRKVAATRGGRGGRYREATKIVLDPERLTPGERRLLAKNVYGIDIGGWKPTVIKGHGGPGSKTNPWLADEAEHLGKVIGDAFRTLKEGVKEARAKGKTPQEALEEAKTRVEARHGRGTVQLLERLGLDERALETDVVTTATVPQPLIGGRHVAAPALAGLMAKKLEGRGDGKGAKGEATGVKPRVVIATQAKTLEKPTYTTKVLPVPLEVSSYRGLTLTLPVPLRLRKDTRIRIVTRPVYTIRERRVHLPQEVYRQIAPTLAIPLRLERSRDTRVVTQPVYTTRVHRVVLPVPLYRQVPAVLPIDLRQRQVTKVREVPRPIYTVREHGVVLPVSVFRPLATTLPIALRLRQATQAKTLEKPTYTTRVLEATLPVDEYRLTTATQPVRVVIVRVTVPKPYYEVVWIPVGGAPQGAPAATGASAGLPPLGYTPAGGGGARSSKAKYRSVGERVEF